MLDTEEYVEDISNNEASTKSTGVLILDPSVGVKVPNGQKVTFLYTIDYRSFYLDAEEYSFVFEIENGISKGKKQTATKIEYDMLFKVPCNEDTKPYTYKIYDSLMEGASGIELSNPEYRIYNEIEGTYEVVTSPVFPSGKASPAYGIYAVYKVKVKEELINQINNPDGGGVMSYNDGKAYKLSILKETEEFSGKELAELAFNNKIELLVEATFMDVK